MSLSVGDKERIKEIKKKSREKIIEEMKQNCLSIAYLMIEKGETRKADEAIRVLMRIEKGESVPKEKLLNAIENLKEKINEGIEQRSIFEKRDGTLINMIDKVFNPLVGKGKT